MIVRRSKKCMDFTITFHVIHLIFCIVYKAFPVYWEWYVFIVLHGIIMTLVGEFSCYWREQREINLPATSKLTSSSKHSSSAKLNQPTQEEDVDEEELIDSTTERTTFFQTKEKQ